MPKFVSDIDLNENEIKNAKMEVHSSDPTLGNFEGRLIYQSTHKTLKVHSGTAFRNMVYDVTSSTDALTASSSNGSVSLSVADATTSAAGLMPSADKTKLDDATDANTASKIVQRDGSGNFSAGTITASLTGNVTGDVTGSVTGTVSSIANHDTDALSEGTSNLYYTDARVRANRLDQLTAPTGDVSFNSQKITNLADPVADSDAATKSYVDAARSGLDVKASVRVATTADITLSGTQTIDGVALSTGDRVLVKDQSPGSENGIYVVASGSWSRATDADSSAEVTAGMFTFVEQGTVNADRGYVLTTDGAITVGSTALTFTQFSGAGQITAGDGLAKSGDTLSVNVDNSTIEIATDTLGVKDAGITAAKIASAVAGDGLTGGAGSALAVDPLAAGGLQISSSQLSIKLDSNSALSLSAGGLTVASSIAGSGLTWTSGVISVDSVDLTSGVTGTLPIANGGTNATTAAAARTSLDVPRKFVAAVPSGSTSATVTHNLGTSDVIVQVYEVSSGENVLVDIARVDSTSTASDDDVTMTFSVAPSANQYRVVIAAVE